MRDSNPGPAIPNIQIKFCSLFILELGIRKLFICKLTKLKCALNQKIQMGDYGFTVMPGLYIYGIWDKEFLFLLLLASANPVITFLRVNKLWLMSIDSFYANPVVPV